MKEAPSLRASLLRELPRHRSRNCRLFIYVYKSGTCAGENPVGFGWFPRCTQKGGGIKTDTRDPTGSRGIFRAPEKMPGSRFCRTQQEFGNQKSRICRGNRQSGFCFYGWAAFRPPARRIFCGICFLWDACCFQRFCGIGSPDSCHRTAIPAFRFPTALHLPSVSPIFRPLDRNGNFPAAARLPADFSCSYSLKQSGGGWESSRRREAWREGASFKRRPPSKVLPYHPNLNGRVTGNSGCDER